MTERCYVIVTTENKYLYFNQCSQRDIDVVPMTEFYFATFIESKERAIETIKELYGQKETEWDYSTRYPKDSLRAGEVIMTYEEIID